MAKVTIFESVGLLTKKFWADGRKEGSPPFSRGTFEVRDIPDHGALKTLIENLNHYQALCYSIPVDFIQGTIVTKGNEDEEQNVISRTKAYFDYLVGEGWLFIDSDEGLSEREVLKRLTDLYPPFGKTTYVYATSASNGIGDKCGFHLYFKVEDISIVKQAMDNLFKKAFNAGYGTCIVTDAGSVLNRTFFDSAVYGRAGLDFISGPKCVDFKAPPRDIKVADNEIDSIDLTPLLEYVDATEAIAQASYAVRGEKVAKRIKESRRRMISTREYNRILDDGVLQPRAKLVLEDNSEIDVSEILQKSMQAYLDEEELEPIVIQHPIEKGLQEKTKLYFNPETGVPRIHSFAHGGQRWDLKDDGSVLEKLEGPDYLIEHLKVAHGLASTPPESEKLPMHKDAKAVLELMVETFTEEYQNERILSDQWREMISLFLQLIDGHRGRYSIELPPSHGKTQVICHVILWLYKSKRVVPISLSIFKIDDIEKIKKWLLDRMDKQWRAWETKDRSEFLYDPADYLKVRHSRERTPFEELDKAPVIIHTHHVVRRNDFKEMFFSYKGEERSLFIFDEAMSRSLIISEDLEDSIHPLNYAITAVNSGSVKGLPVRWLEAFREKIEKAQEILLENKLVKDVKFSMPTLSERFVNTGYYLDNEQHQNFILILMNIGAAEDREFRVSREMGAKAGKVLFSYKENDISRLPRVVTTDATRSVRRVHSYGSSCIKYPITPYEGDEGVTYWVAPFKKTGRVAYGDEPILHILIANLWLKMIKPRKVLVIASKATQFDKLDIKENGYEALVVKGLISADLPVNSFMLQSLSPDMLHEEGEAADGIHIDFGHPDVESIHWGQHKQSNDFQDCDAVIVMNYLRKRSYNYKHDIYGELTDIIDLKQGAIKDVEVGFIVDELIQGFCRGVMRKGERQNCLMFTPHNQGESVKITELLEENIRSQDEVKLLCYPPIISALDPSYKTEQEIKERTRNTRSDKKYASGKEKGWARSFRRACAKGNIGNCEELEGLYLEAKKNDVKVTPKKWLKENMTTRYMMDDS